MVESSGFFIESTTGVRKPLNHPSYKSINSAWNHENYYCLKQNEEDWKTSKSLDLGQSVSKPTSNNTHNFILLLFATCNPFFLNLAHPPYDILQISLTI